MWEKVPSWVLKATHNKFLPPEAIDKKKDIERDDLKSTKERLEKEIAERKEKLVNLRRKKI